jgi:apoptosis-inducing factor 3
MVDDAQVELRDLALGIAADELAGDAIVAGKVGEDEVIVVRRGGEIFAVGAHCTHYHGPLAEGLPVGDTLRCPWHHAEFCLRTGAATRAPALDPIACFRVEQRGGQVFVRERLPAAAPPRRAEPAGAPRAIVIVGGGAAGLAAADMLRREGFDGSLTMLSADSSPPVDRPNLSKDFLAGTAQEDWIPLRAPEYYTEREIELVLDTHVDTLDVARRHVTAGGREHKFDALLIATGAEPVKLDIPGADAAQVHYLRSFADSKRIVAAAGDAQHALVVGTSFIGLEVAASLRARGLEVHVVGPDKVPLERVMGAAVGRFVQGVHEANGVTFHLGATVARMDGTRATLSDGHTLAVDLVVLGVGVRPLTALAERAGLALDRGISVDRYLATSASGIYAAGDVARWPDPHTGERIRVEHWVVAGRQGQVAAQNMLGREVPFDAVPFFWSQHFDAVIHYVGHAERFDEVAIDGSLDARDATISYRLRGRTLAIATVDRDLESLRAEAALESATRRA